MAKKGQTKDSTENPTNKNENLVTNLWTDFSGQMENRLRELFESSAAEYQDIYKSWTELSDKMGQQMLGFTLGDESIYKDIYNSWNEYSERLNNDLKNISNVDDKSYTDFYDFWSKYSDQFSAQLSDLLREGIKEQYELYELWMDTFAKSASEGSKSGDIPSIINKYWLETFNRFNDFYSKTRLDPDTKRTELGEGVYKQYEEMYNYWINTSSKMLDEVMRSPAYGNFLAQSISSSMDTRKMIENITTQNLKNLGIPTKNELEEIRFELKNISSRLDEITQVLRDKSKSK